MSKRVGMEASFAIAEAAKLAETEVVAAYPITPQTHIVERLSEIVADGELDAEFICVESEHSAMSACIGSSAVGARTFTATAGQGLELMHEVLYVAASSRLPIVMAVANRALSGPLNVWGDHSDVMATRDCGRIQYFTENAQEAFDLTLCAFKIAEAPEVLFPLMVHLDGFHVSHVVEPLYLLEKEEIAGFIPPLRYPFPLDPRKPVTMGAFAPPVLYTESKKALEVALRSTKETILRVWKEFGDAFGRYYNPVESYRAEDAETLLLAIGSFTETATVAIDTLRNRGEKVGLIRLRLWRPFPFDEVRAALRSAQQVIIFDRSISLGGPGGPLCSEIKSALYQEPKKPKIVSFIGGLGGRDITPQQFEQMFARCRELIDKKIDVEYETIGVRE
ncbi:MAG: pyruvate ferredoxin oxidoreductase [Proteobacteria bacterium]|nr:pyruvate ferredoxin oxidoreductase [Pseudomonadota bacterium]